MSDKPLSDKQLANLYLLAKFGEISEELDEGLLDYLNESRRMSGGRKEKIFNRVKDWLEKKGKPLGDYLVKQGIAP